MIAIYNKLQSPSNILQKSNIRSFNEVKSEINASWQSVIFKWYKKRAMSDSSIKFCFFQRIKITYFASCSLLFICSIPCSKRVLHMQRKKNIYLNRSMSIIPWNQVHIRTFSLNLTELVTMLLIVMKITNLSEFSSSGGWGTGLVFCCLRTLCTRVWKHRTKQHNKIQTSTEKNFQYTK